MEEVKDIIGDSSIAKHRERVIYVEPNDVYDFDTGNKDQGHTLTPKYEDFSIYFNLIIENFKRFKQNQINGESNNKSTTYAIRWGLSSEDLVKRRTSVLQGDRGYYTLDADGNPKYDVQDYNYLTTYYTDISTDSYYEKTEIEGLGVTSVDISYESWYTPTVTIKFVDVRGAALFGREEAIHVDEHLNAENVFGAFFSMPYPLFRLQVKGFFGKPVTYQLTCSNFKADFNSNTGNFEAVATFIGYSWSLLTDIPFSYLVAAPYAPYIGQKYWDRKVNSKEWAMWDNGNTTTPPIKLADLFQRIKNADSTIENQIALANDEESALLSDYQSETTSLNLLKTSLSALKSDLKRLVDNKFIEATYSAEGADVESDQLMLFSDTAEVTVGDSFKETSKKFYDSLNAYVTKPTGNEDFYTKKPNNLEGFPDKFVFSDTFIIVKNGDSEQLESITFTDHSDVTKEGLMELQFNPNIKLNDSIAEAVCNAIDEKNSSATKICKYVYVFEFNDLMNEIDARLDKLKKDVSDLSREINARINYNINSIVGFKPFIGNIFKLIFCHLETFCHIIFDSAAEIYEQKNSNGNDRLPEKLGINITNTDINGKVCNYVTPWPAVFNKGKLTQEAGYESNFENVYGWVGDFSQNFIEMQVVYSIQEGIQRIAQSLKDTASVEDINTFPITPVDMVYKPSPFSGVSAENISDLSGYLAIRMAHILGVVFDDSISEDFAKQLGVMDAYNYYTENGNVGSLGTIITQGAVEDIKNIMYCNADGDKYATNKADSGEVYHNFETVKQIKKEYNNQGRKPMFLKQEDNHLFVQWYDKNDISFTPARLYPFDLYNKENFLYYCPKDAEPYFIPMVGVWSDNKTINFKEAIYNSSTSQIKEVTGHNKPNQKIAVTKTENSLIFDIITEEKQIKRILKLNERYANSEFEVNGYKFDNLDLSDFKDRVIKVDTSSYTAFFKKQGVLTTTLEKSGGDQSVFVDRGFKFSADDKTSSEATHFRWENTKNWLPTAGDQTGIMAEPIFMNEDGKLSNSKNEEYSESDAAINFLLMWHNNHRACIFGTPFYYMQAERDANGKRVDKSYKERYLKVRALLFLHTLRYNFSEVKISAFSNEKTNGSIQVVPKAYALLLGGLLWRQRWAAENNGIEPIGFVAKVLDEKGNVKSRHCYKRCDIKNTMFQLNDNKLYQLIVWDGNGEITDQYNVPIDAIFPNYEKLDVIVKNKLINMFIDFADNEFVSLSNELELKAKYDGGVVTELTHDKLQEHLRTLTNAVYNPEYTNFNAWFAKNGFPESLKQYRGMSIEMEQDGKKSPNGQQLLMMLDDTNTKIQTILKDLFLGKCLFMDTCHKLKIDTQDAVTDSDKIIIKNSLFDAYLNGFYETIKNIVEQKGTQVQIGDNFLVSEETVKNRDLSISIYYFIKNLWDRWMVTADTNAFDVSEFFMKNFVFIDSFYNNTYHLLAINCNKFLEAWTQLADKGSLFQFIGRIVSDHHCIFAPVPDYVGFNNPDQTEDIKTMENLFRPMPFDDIPLPSNSNKYIVMYAQDYSKMPTGDNGYVVDSFDIWSHSGKNDISEDAAKCFAATTEVDYDEKNPIATKYGYNVPSFGVAFGRQNNHLFKNIKLGMDNPVVTEQAIKAQYEIMSLASGGGRKVNFIGQDTFNVFTNYSYSATIEMMGNAQICPFMYFQLLNVPMWRGTYMIYKVSHTMTPGDMTTTFTGMKMSKYSKPYNTTFFTYNALDSNSGDVYNSSDGSSESGGSGGGGGKTTLGALEFNVSDLTSNSISQYEFEVMQSQEKTFMGKYNKTNYNNAVKIANRLVEELGLKDWQAAGIVGCLIQESDCTTDAENSDGGEGICQWTQQGIKNAARRAAGVSLQKRIIYCDLDQQIDMLIGMCTKEQEGYEGWTHGYKVIKKTENVIDACRVWALVEAGRGSDSYTTVQGAIKVTQGKYGTTNWDMSTIKVDGKKERKSLWMARRIYYAQSFYNQWKKPQ